LSLRSHLAAAIIAAPVIAGCGGSDGDPSTVVADNPTSIAAYCTAVNAAPTIGFDEALHELDKVALPAIADLIDRLLSNQWSQEAWFELGDFNEETCGLRWP
jgi:hypothetical protein